MRRHIKGVDHICCDEDETSSNKPCGYTTDDFPGPLIAFETQVEDDK